VTARSPPADYCSDFLFAEITMFVRFTTMQSAASLSRVRILAFRVAALAVPLVSTIPAAAQGVSTPEVLIGWRNGYQWNPGNGAAQFVLQSRFRINPPATPWQNSNTVHAFDFQGPNPSTFRTDTVTVTSLPSTATGYAVATRSYNDNFPLYNMIVTGHMVMTPPTPNTTPPKNTEGEFWVRDPIGYIVGKVGTNITSTISLMAGTSFSGTEVVPGVPNLNVDMRFGVGSSFKADDPATLWGDSGPLPTPPPPNAFDLYNISIAQNSAGTGVQAIVSPDPSSSLDGLSVLSSQTRSQIESAIEGANWVHSGDLWTLKSDLSLYQITLTNEQADNEGMPMVIGTFFSGAGSLTSTPEPSTLVLLVTGMLVLSGYRVSRKLVGARSAKRLIALGRRD
jgi:hypothetical protein